MLIKRVSHWRFGEIENDSATILARAGYKISQNTGEKGRNGTSDPDYDIDGKLWDCYAPSSGNRDSIRSELKDKAKSSQAVSSSTWSAAR